MSDDELNGDAGLDPAEIVDPADERFRVLARAAREAVIIHEKGIVREVNDAFVRLLGYTREEIIGKESVSTLVSPESQAEVRRSMQIAEGGGTSEVVLLTRTGERRTVESVSAPIRYQGRLMRVVTMQDRTERIALDAERRRTAALLQAIVENTNQLVFVKDLDGRMLLGNAAFRGEGDIADAATSGDVLAQAGPFTVENVVQTEDGERRFLTTKFLLRDDAGAPYAFGGIATDITERRRATDLLAAISRDTLGTVGQAFFEALARTLAVGLGGDYCMVGELLPGGTRVRSLAAWQEGALAPPLEYDIAGTPSETIVARKSCVLRDGLLELYPDDPFIRAHRLRGYLGVPILGGDGETEGAVAVLFRRSLGADTEAAVVTIELVAARVAAELERARAIRVHEEIRAELERRVSERTAELVSSNEELEAFAYSVSHDLRAPLRHTAGYAELLRRQASSVLDEKSHRFLDTIMESSKRMGVLIDDLLAFSRIGRAETNKTAVRLDQLVDEVVAEIRQDVSDREITWKLARLPACHGDRAMLRVALVNLISNAVKFTRARQPAEIEIGCRDGSRDDVEIFIKDNGAGFDMQYQNKLFGVFQRLHLAEEFEGTGIGLATVQRIIQRHGGTVRAEGAVDRGATFYVSLPKA
jgi:PAS domain S-box-containing protein